MLGVLLMGSSTCVDARPRLMNDLWQWDPQTNVWTWRSGSQTKSEPGIYGSYQVKDISNVPGARCMHSMAVHTMSGMLMVFGGEGYDAMLLFGIIFRYIFRAEFFNF